MENKQNSETDDWRIRNARSLSLNARLAIALHCFEQCCLHWKFDVPAIHEFLDHMWEWPVMTEEKFGRWDLEMPDLLDYGLGAKLESAELKAQIHSKGVNEDKFRMLTESTVEVLYSSYQVACDDDGSMRFLVRVFTISDELGISIPPFGIFESHRVKGRFGWGPKMVLEERDRWRNLEW